MQSTRRSVKRKLFSDKEEEEEEEVVQQQRPIFTFAFLLNFKFYARVTLHRIHDDDDDEWDVWYRLESPIRLPMHRLAFPTSTVGVTTTAATETKVTVAYLTRQQKTLPDALRLGRITEPGLHLLIAEYAVSYYYYFSLFRVGGVGVLRAIPPVLFSADNDNPIPFPIETLTFSFCCSR